MSNVEVQSNEADLGEVEGANIIKIHRRSGKLSYLVYPDFDSDPHPALLRCIRLSLRTRELHCYDYAGSANPPILHRKETFLPLDRPALSSGRGDGGERAHPSSSR